MMAQYDRVANRYLVPAAEYRQMTAELERLREVLAGTAPAEGSWQVEALALRAEVERLLEVNGDLLTESRQLHDLVKAVVQAWTTYVDPGNPKLFHADLRRALDALARAHDPQEQAAQELVDLSQEQGLYEDGGQDR